MSILKKFFKAVKKIFVQPSRRRKKAGKKRSALPGKKRSLPKTRKKIKKVPARSAKSFVSSRRARTQPKLVKKVKKETEPSGLRLGEVTHYFDRIKVCVIRIDQGAIKKGDRLLIKGSKSQLAQKVLSMQIENEDVSSAKKGQLIGLKVTKPVSAGDEVFGKKP